MHQHVAQQAAAQMPQVARPDPLDIAAVDELAEDGVNAVAHTAEHGAPARVRIALGRAAEAKVEKQEQPAPKKKVQKKQKPAKVTPLKRPQPVQLALTA